MADEILLDPLRTSASRSVTAIELAAVQREVEALRDDVVSLADAIAIIALECMRNAGHEHRLKPLREALERAEAISAMYGREL